MSWTITGAGASPRLLDAYPGASAAYSLRNLSWAYGGPVVRVRRSSDNAEQDFTAAQVTDGTLTTFCGAGNGFVRTWYDQSGNGRHATQTTTANQPNLVSSGVLVTDGSKPAIEFNGTSKNMTASFSATLNQPSTIFSVAQPRSFGELKYIVDGIDTSNRNVLDVDPGQKAILFAGSGITSTVNHGLQRRLLTGLFNTTASTLRQNAASVATGDINNAPTTGFTIGSRFSNVGYWDGFMQEIVFYNSDRTANLTAIEANINAHYSIY